MSRDIMIVPMPRIGSDAVITASASGMRADLQAIPSLRSQSAAADVDCAFACRENTVGVALTALSPTGKVLVRGEYWNAVRATPVAPGTCIRVVGVEGLTLEVEPTS